MPQSKKRGGKKAHNKRVKARNQRMEQDRKKMNKIYTEMMEQKLKEFQENFASMSGETESNNLNEDLDTTLSDNTKIQVAGFHNVTEND